LKQSYFNFFKDYIVYGVYQI